MGILVGLEPRVEEVWPLPLPWLKLGEKEGPV